MGAKASQITSLTIVYSTVYSEADQRKHWPLCGEFTGDRWIPRTNGQYRGKCLMTSSCALICFVLDYGPLARYAKLWGAHAPGMPGTFSPSPQVSDPDMHHGTCVTHVPWCMPGSLTSGFLWNRRRGKTFPAFPAHAQPAILRIW